MGMEKPHTIVDEQTGKRVSYTSGSREYVTSDTGETPPFRKFVLDPEAYGDAISSFVQKTCDVLAYDPDTGRVLVATRAKEPQRGDWVVGGRKYAGESDHGAALRNLKREMGARIAAMAEGRLTKIEEPYDVIWDSREHPATLNEAGEQVTGTHQAPTVFALPVSEAGFMAAAEPNEEYSGLRWEDGFDIMDSPDGVYHPAFRDMVADMLEQVTRPVQ
ncbi:MAG TPA: NUDIX domain-containing protein [Candidatus Saccharimonadales bacterium]|nr:NUDIX domain-containing protein [Candidatus Saccharimonadales bacterium]